MKTITGRKIYKVMKTITIGGRTYGEVEVGEEITCKGCIFLHRRMGLEHATVYRG